jgi:Protein of unknown function (DUF1064)
LVRKFWWLFKFIFIGAVNTVLLPVSWTEKQLKNHPRFANLVPQQKSAAKSLPGPVRSKQGWVEVGGKRCFFRSKMEVRYAAVLEMFKKGGAIREWEYEPKVFWFKGILRGVNNYKPDFRVTQLNGFVEYHEVKGFMDRKSRTKLKRMKKYFPGVVVRLIDQAWFKANSRNIPKLC